jgi:hypothetical protein
MSKQGFLVVNLKSSLKLLPSWLGLPLRNIWCVTVDKGKCLVRHSYTFVHVPDPFLIHEKIQKDKQRSTKHTDKTKDRGTRTPLKTGGELRCSRRLSGSCSTNDTRRVNLVTNPVISHERGKEREVQLYDKRYDFNFPIVKFPFICSNIPAVPAYGVYISQLIRYSRTCGF